MADTVKVGPWGAPDGQARDGIPGMWDKAGPNAISWGWDSWNGRIPGISFVYVDQEDQPVLVGRWGKIDPELSETIEIMQEDQLNCFDLNQGEYVKNIFGSFDDDNGVNSLQFTTNKKNVHGPYGRLWGTVFNVPLPDKAVVGNQNGAVVGFFGRSGWDGLVPNLKP